MQLAMKHITHFSLKNDFWMQWTYMELVLTEARVCVSAMVKFRKLPPERTKLLVRLNKMCLC